MADQRLIIEIIGDMKDYEASINRAKALTEDFAKFSISSTERIAKAEVEAFQSSYNQVSEIRKKARADIDDEYKFAMAKAIENTAERLRIEAEYNEKKRQLDQAMNEELAKKRMDAMQSLENNMNKYGEEHLKKRKDDTIKIIQETYAEQIKLAQGNMDAVIQLEKQQADDIKKIRQAVPPIPPPQADNTKKPETGFAAAGNVLKEGAIGGLNKLKEAADSQLGIVGKAMSALGPWGAGLNTALGGVMMINDKLKDARQAARDFHDMGKKIETLLTNSQAKALPDAMSSLRKIARETGEPLAKLNQSLYLTISGIPSLANNLNAATSIVEKSSKAAIGLGANADSVTRAMVSLGNATNLSMEDTKNQELVLDTIANTMKQGVIPNAEVLAGSISKTAPAFASLDANGGRVVQNIGAMTTVLTQNGISVQQAQTKMSAFAKELLNTSKLPKLIGAGLEGMNAQTGKIEDWDKLMTSLGKNSGEILKIFTSEQAKGAVRIFGKEGGQAMVDLMQNFQNAGGTANDMYETMASTYERTAKRREAAEKDFQITIGKMVPNIMGPFNKLKASALELFNDIFTSASDKFDKIMKKGEELNQGSQKAAGLAGAIDTKLATGDVSQKDITNMFGQVSKQMKDIRQISPFLASEISKILNNPDKKTAEGLAEVSKLLKDTAQAGAGMGMANNVKAQEMAGQKFRETLEQDLTTWEKYKTYIMGAVSIVAGPVGLLYGTIAGIFGATASKSDALAQKFQTAQDTIGDTSTKLAEAKAELAGMAVGSEEWLAKTYEINALTKQQGEAQGTVNHIYEAQDQLVKDFAKTMDENAEKATFMALLEKQAAEQRGITVEQLRETPELYDRLVATANSEWEARQKVIQGQREMNGLIQESTAIQADTSLSSADKEKALQLTVDNHAIQMLSLGLTQQQVEEEMKKAGFADQYRNFKVEQITAEMQALELIKAQGGQLDATQEKRLNELQTQQAALQGEYEKSNQAEKYFQFQEKQLQIQMDNLKSQQDSGVALTEQQQIELQLLETNMEKAKLSHLDAELKGKINEQLWSEQDIQKGVNDLIQEKIGKESKNAEQRIKTLQDLQAENNARINTVKTQIASLSAVITGNQMERNTLNEVLAVQNEINKAKGIAVQGTIQSNNVAKDQLASLKAELANLEKTGSVIDKQIGAAQKQQNMERTLGIGRKAGGGGGRKGGGKSKRDTGAAKAAAEEKKRLKEQEKEAARAAAEAAKEAENRRKAQLANEEYWYKIGLDKMKKELDAKNERIRAEDEMARQLRQQALERFKAERALIEALDAIREGWNQKTVDIMSQSAQALQGILSALVPKSGEQMMSDAMTQAGAAVIKFNKELDKSQKDLKASMDKEIALRDKYRDKNKDRLDESGRTIKGPETLAADAKTRMEREKAQIERLQNALNVVRQPGGKPSDKLVVEVEKVTKSTQQLIDKLAILRAKRKVFTPQKAKEKTRRGAKTPAAVEAIKAMSELLKDLGIARNTKRTFEQDADKIDQAMNVLAEKITSAPKEFGKESIDNSDAVNAYNNKLRGLEKELAKHEKALQNATNLQNANGNEVKQNNAEIEKLNNAIKEKRDKLGLSAEIQKEKAPELQLNKEIEGLGRVLGIVVQDTRKVTSAFMDLNKTIDPVNQNIKFEKLLGLIRKTSVSFEDANYQANNLEQELNRIEASASKNGVAITKETQTSIDTLRRLITEARRGQELMRLAAEDEAQLAMRMSITASAYMKALADISNKQTEQANLVKAQTKISAEDRVTQELRADEAIMGIRMKQITDQINLEQQKLKLLAPESAEYKKITEQITALSIEYNKVEEIVRRMPEMRSNLINEARLKDEKESLANAVALLDLKVKAGVIDEEAAAREKLRLLRLQEQRNATETGDNISPEEKQKRDLTLRGEILAAEKAITDEEDKHPGITKKAAEEQAKKVAEIQKAVQFMEKFSNILTDLPKQVDEVTRSFQKGAMHGIGTSVSKGGDLMRKVGEALLAAPPPLSTAGAVMLAGGFIASTFGKIMEMFSSKELTSLEKARLKAEVEKNTVSYYNQQLGLMTDMTAMGSTLVDQARERLYYAQQEHEMLKANSHQVEIYSQYTDEHLIQEKSRMNMDLMHLQNRLAEIKAHGGKEGDWDYDEIQRRIDVLTSKLGLVDTEINYRKQQITELKAMADEIVKGLQFKIEVFTNLHSDPQRIKDQLLGIEKTLRDQIYKTVGGQGLEGAALLNFVAKIDVNKLSPDMQATIKSWMDAYKALAQADQTLQEAYQRRRDHDKKHIDHLKAVGVILAQASNDQKLANALYYESQLTNLDAKIGSAQNYLNKLLLEHASIEDIQQAEETLWGFQEERLKTQEDYAKSQLELSKQALQINTDQLDYQRKYLEFQHATHAIDDVTYNIRLIGLLKQKLMAESDYIAALSAQGAPLAEINAAQSSIWDTLTEIYNLEHQDAGADYRMRLLDYNRKQLDYKLAIKELTQEQYDIELKSQLDQKLALQHVMLNELEAQHATTDQILGAKEAIFDTEIEIYNLLHKENQLENEKLRVAKELNRERNKMVLEAKRGGAPIDREKVKTLEDQIIAELRKAGASEDQINRQIATFKQTLPQFALGGRTDGGLASLHPGEFILNPGATKSLDQMFPGLLESMNTGDPSAGLLRELAANYNKSQQDLSMAKIQYQSYVNNNNFGGIYVNCGDKATGERIAMEIQKAIQRTLQGNGIQMGSL